MNEELSNIWNYLGNLEGTHAYLENMENLLIMLEETYFMKGNIDLNNIEDMYDLWREYKYCQSLLFTINQCITEYNIELRKNIDNIYDSVKILKNSSSDFEKSFIKSNLAA